MKQTNAGSGELDGFLGKGTGFEGELRFENTFRVEGKINGKVATQGDLIVGEGGEVEGEIRVGRLFASGTVRGSVHAQRRIEISASADVQADLETPALAIEDGARYQGRCSMNAPQSQGEVKGPPQIDRPLPERTPPAGGDGGGAHPGRRDQAKTS